jgi:mRNA interferase MazF
MGTVPTASPSPTAHPQPKRGDIWLIDFDPPIGAEIGKVRPAVVINQDSVGRLPLRMVVPITDWKPKYLTYPWFIFLKPDLSNGLLKDGGADTFQLKSVSLHRFIRRLGELRSGQLDDMATAIRNNVGAP